MALVGPNTTDAHLQLYAGQLDMLTNKSIIDLALIVDEFVRQFPEGSNALIHCQGNKVFNLFQNKLLKFLDIFLNADIGYFHRFASTDRRGQCVEAVLLQHLAKLPMPLNSTSSLTPMSAFYKKSFAQHIQELINRTTNYIASSKNFQENTITTTLSALTHFDISSLKLSDLVKVSHEKILNSLDLCKPASIIRAIHSMILLSHENVKFKTYLSDDQVKKLLSAVTNIVLERNNSSHQSLANQLYQIRNIYPDFPRKLSDSIEPFLAGFQEQAHGSGFEAKACKAVRDAINNLKRKYPGLIDAKYFDPKNPINAALGLESDFTYVQGDLRVCMQVDGDKYHLYPGTKMKTQRTKLRDYAFKEWKIIVFTGSLPQGSYFDAAKKLTEEASNQLLTNVVIPTFDMTTRENIDFIKKSKDSFSKDFPPSLQYDKNKSDFALFKNAINDLKSLNIASFNHVVIAMTAKIDLFQKQMAAREVCQSDLIALLRELDQAIASSIKMPLVSNKYSALHSSMKALNETKDSLNEKLITYKKDLSDKTKELASLESDYKKEFESLGRGFSAGLATKPLTTKIAMLKCACEELQKKYDAIPAEITACEHKDLLLQQELQDILAQIAKPIPGSELVKKCQVMAQNIQLIKQEQDKLATDLPEWISYMQKSLINAKAEQTQAAAKRNQKSPVSKTQSIPAKSLAQNTMQQYEQAPAYYPMQQMGAFYPPQQASAYYPPQQARVYYPPQHSSVYYPPHASVYYPPQQASVYYPPQGTVYFPQDAKTYEESYEESYEDETYQEVYEAERGGATYYWENAQSPFVPQYRAQAAQQSPVLSLVTDALAPQPRFKPN
jgi:hypothetical protein